MGFLKVMLVDDDRLSVEYMRALVDWEAMGFQISCVAYNGKQALKSFRQHTPQLIISDISMPLMDGIELARAVTAESPETHLLLLTAYDEFDYVRNAMKLGVDDYLIKSELTAELLAASLQKTRGLIARETQLSALLLQQAVTAYCCEGADFVRGQFDDAAILQFFERPHHFLLCSQDVPIVTGEQPVGTLSGAELLAPVLGRFGGGVPVQHAVLPGGCLLLIFSELTAKTLRGRFGGPKDFAQAVQLQLQQLFSCSISVFYTQQPVRFGHIADLLGRQNETLHKLCFCRGAGTVHPADAPLPSVGFYQRTITEQMLDRLPDCQTEQEVRAALGDILDGGNLESYRYRTLQQMASQLLSHLRGRFGESAAPTAPLLDYQGFVAYVASCILGGQSSPAGACRPEVEKAMELIRTRYPDADLCISRIAEAVGISNSRLSVIFKEDTGVTVNQFLTRQRIQAAKRLLLAGQHKIYEIAEKTGYTNSQYFSTIFFKETGTYPTDFKKGAR